MNWKCNKKLILIFNLSIALSLLGCSKEYKTLTIQQILLADLKDLEDNNTDFQFIAENETDTKKVQQAFNATRIAYKKIEWAVEYFTPDPARFINGPALDELEVAENKYLSPNGFQVIEELIYPTYNPKNQANLVREIKMIKANLNQVKQSLGAITISNDFVLDASKMQINRILALGITGFDSPIALQSIPETKTSVLALSAVIKNMNYTGAISSTIEKKIANLCSQAATYCQENSNFNTFDRAHFIKTFLNPISKNLIDFQETNAISNTGRNSALRQDSPTVFEKQAFDVNAFIPAKEYQYTIQKAALGKQLFYDKSFSKDKIRNCATCHDPALAFSDNLKTNTAIKGGKLQRNTPTLTYASLQNGQFWDMRQLDLEKQSTDVIQNQDEMHGELSSIIRVLNQDEEYQTAFKTAFPKSKKIEEWQIQNALASYIRSLNSFDSKFDKYMRGESENYTSQEKLGFNLFSGKAKCATCHFIPLFNGTVPPKFNKTEHEIIGTPEHKDGHKISPDPGRYLQYQMAQLKNAFKTPTLRNAAKTAPYMHNGVFSTLYEVIDFYNKGGGLGSGIVVENQSLPADKLDLSEKEKNALIAFMHTLSDEKYQD